MVADRIHHGLEASVSGGAVEDFELVAERADFGMGLLRHGCRVLEHALAVGEDRKVWIANVVGVARDVLRRSGLTLNVFVQCEEELEAQTCLGDECVLSVVEANRLRSATASPRCGEVQHVVLAIEVPHVDGFAALVGQLNVFNGVAEVAPRGGQGARVSFAPSARVAGIR